MHLGWQMVAQSVERVKRTHTEEWCDSIPRLRMRLGMVQSHSQLLRENLGMRLGVMWPHSQALGHCLLKYESPGMKLDMVRWNVH